MVFVTEAMCPNLKIGYHKGNIWEAKGLLWPNIHFIPSVCLFSILFGHFQILIVVSFIFLFSSTLTSSEFFDPASWFLLPRFGVRFLIVSIPNRVSRSSLPYSANSSLRSHSANRSHRNSWSVISSLSFSFAFFISSSVYPSPFRFCYRFIRYTSPIWSWTWLSLDRFVLHHRFIRSTSSLLRA